MKKTLARTLMALVASLVLVAGSLVPAQAVSVSFDWRVIEEEVIPASQELGLSQIVWSPIAQGVLTGKYKKGQPLPEGSRATDEAAGARAVSRYLDDEILAAVAGLDPAKTVSPATRPS